MKKLLASFLSLLILLSFCTALAEYTDAETILAVQQALTDAGYYKGNISGIKGNATEAAIRNYQTAKGLTASGQIDDDLLAALGIGGGTPAVEEPAAPVQEEATAPSNEPAESTAPQEAAPAEQSPVAGETAEYELVIPGSNYLNGFYPRELLNSANIVAQYEFVSFLGDRETHIAGPIFNENDFAIDVTLSNLTVSGIVPDDVYGFIDLHEPIKENNYVPLEHVAAHGRADYELFQYFPDGMDYASIENMTVTILYTNAETGETVAELLLTIVYKH